MKIQIIDDEPIHNFITSRLFKQINPDLQLFDFIDPVVALESVSKINPDIIFLDLNMPKLNGWEFLDKMMAIGLTHRVIILTSSVSHFDHSKSKEYPNVVDCVEKPIKKERLAEIIAHV